MTKIVRLEITNFRALAELTLTSISYILNLFLKPLDMLTVTPGSLSCKGSVTRAVISLMHNALFLNRLYHIKNSSLHIGSIVNKLRGVTS